jgi:hypothetical protein
MSRTVSMFETWYLAPQHGLAGYRHIPCSNGRTTVRMKKWQALQAELHRSPRSNSLERTLCSINLLSVIVSKKTTTLVDGRFYRLHKSLLTPYLNMHTGVARVTVVS